MALRRRLQEYKPPDAPKKRSTKLNYFLYVAVLAVLVSSSLFKARDYLSEIQESLLILADFTAISAPTVRLPVRSTPDSEKEPSLSENLESEDYFMRNSRNLTFQTNVRVWNETGKICLNITLRDPDGSCRYPYFRARLSGVAVMDIPIGGRSLDLDNHFDPNGCALFPVPGNYTLDVVLLHCTMNAWPHDASSGILRSQCPVLPEPRDNVGTYKISVGPFERDDNLVSSLWPLRNPFPRRAFVYFRPCPGERYRIASRCTAASNEEPPVVRVSYQRAGVEYNEKPAIFDKYVYLEVDANNGAVNYSSGYTLSRYAPPPQDFESEDTVCFLGDSHARYLSYQTRMIYLNKATGKTGCAERELHTSVDIKTGQFRYVVMEFALNFLSGKGINETLFAGCDMVVILYGHWDAGYPNKRPTTPFNFAKLTKAVMEKVQNITKEDTRIYTVSSDHHPLSKRIVKCQDWRLPPLIEVYNAYLRNMTVDGERPGERKFKGLKNAYYLDNNDIMDHIWDEAGDFNHPCTHGFRPMAYRVLSLMKDKATGRPSYIP